MAARSESITVRRHRPSRHRGPRPSPRQPPTPPRPTTSDSFPNSPDSPIALIGPLPSLGADAGPLRARKPVRDWESTHAELLTRRHGDGVDLPTGAGAGTAAGAACRTPTRNEIRPPPAAGPVRAHQRREIRQLTSPPRNPAAPTRQGRRADGATVLTVSQTPRPALLGRGGSAVLRHREHSSPQRRIPVWPNE
jgi:hypothetical protein